MDKKFFATEKRFLGSLRASRAIKKYIISTKSVLEKYMVLCPTRTKILERSLIYIVIAYENGADLGADYIECDVQITKDLHLVCSHEAWIKEVCNVEEHPEFGNRSNTYNMDDDDPDFDWNDKGDIGPNFFTIDFNVDELKTLFRRQVIPSRNPNFDDKYSFVRWVMEFLTRS